MFYNKFRILLLSINLTIIFAIEFTDINNGYIDNVSVNHNASWGDFNNDGYDDFYINYTYYLENSETDLYLFRNNGDNTFTPLLESNGGPGGDPSQKHMVSAWIDYNNDGYLDLLTSCTKDECDSHLLYENNGDETFTLSSESSTFRNVLDVDNPDYMLSQDFRTDYLRPTSINIFDFDGDGYHDIYITNTLHTSPTNNSGAPNDLYINNGDGTFERITEGLIVLDVKRSFAADLIDYDRDGDTDLFVWNSENQQWPGNQNHNMYVNNGDGTYTSITDIEEMGGLLKQSNFYPDMENEGDYCNGLKSLIWDDLNRDGYPDMVENCQYYNYIWINNSDGTFTNSIISGVGANNYAFGSSSFIIADFDNDADLDFFLTGGYNNGWLMLDNGDLTYTYQQSSNVTTSTTRIYSASISDFNRDGFIDMYLGDNSPTGDPALMLNSRDNLNNTNNWINIKLDGSSYYGGAIELIDENNNYQYKNITNTRGSMYGGQNSSFIHFGLGDANEIDQIKVLWPNGTEQIIENINVNQYLTINYSEPITPFQPQTKADLQAAVNMWVDDNATALTSYGEINTWDVSLITDMSDLFLGKETFNDDISNWDVSNVTNMFRMFRDAMSFNSDISLWDVSNVTSTSQMFYNTAFNQDISSWDVSSVTTMAYMFKNATSFNQDISSWDVSSVTNLIEMFMKAESFNQDLSAWDVSSVGDISGMFKEATSFNGDISSWDVSNVIKMGSVFQFATSFNGDISSWDVSNVIRMSFMFYSASSFDQDISSWDISSVYQFAQTFSLTNSLSDYNKCAIRTNWSSINSYFGYQGWLGNCDDDGDGVINLDEIAGCQDSTACNYDADATDDDGSCSYPEENFDCDGNCIVTIDCAGTCGGSALEDECGVCNGDGIADGECDCDGNTLDCAGDCAGSAFVDSCGVCSEGNSGHTAESDQDCNGDCFGDATVDG